jgi:hypothetical protein
MHQIDAIKTRLQEAQDLPALLTAGFDAFETIRALARSSEDENPALFAAFMTAADAAVDGREALTIAPSLPPGRAGPPASRSPAASGTAGQVTGALADLAGVLRSCLTAAASRASLPGDRGACQKAAAAAGHIRFLMAGDGNDRRLR